MACMSWTTDLRMTLTGLAVWFAPHTRAQNHQHDMPVPLTPQGDARQLVTFPDPMRLHTITSMRDHLLAAREIDVALSKERV